MLHQLLRKLAAPEVKPDNPEDLQVAVGVLLVEAARMDDSFDGAERAVIESLLAKKFGLDETGARHVLSEAEETAKRSAQLHPFTRRTVTQMSPAERVKLVEMLWEVAYADGVLDAEEDGLLRRISHLIYVSDEDRAAARLRVLRRLGLPTI